MEKIERLTEQLPVLCSVVMLETFSTALGIEGELGQLSKKEVVEATQLAVKKYSCDSWNFLR
ncbi:hypothetical protein [Sporomusa ovata]|uniref:Uncharacterized protein n=1 Tax=Sporomusa ovata TaxID=2378 RepID=A0A0U1L2I0_9FIRM|nr:hypothetical protein [Sporomusa ovata]CQR73735.1 hypothetical protein SpAn4DRAFT_0197 [Sporomusa ovata]